MRAALGHWWLRSPFQTDKQLFASLGRSQMALQCPQHLTTKLFHLLAAAEALPRRWHLDGQHGAVRPAPDPTMRRLLLTREAAEAIKAYKAGALPSALSGLLTLMPSLDLVALPSEAQTPQLPGLPSCASPETFTFVELFAGLGGFRLGLEALGGRCALASESDAGAREVYSENFHEPEGCWEMSRGLLLGGCQW